jgi:hypothetical protein
VYGGAGPQGQGARRTSPAARSVNTGEIAIDCRKANIIRVTPGTERHRFPDIQRLTRVSILAEQFPVSGVYRFEDWKLTRVSTFALRSATIESEQKMKSTILTILLATSVTLAVSSIANAEGFDRANSKYCQENSFDPLCMDEKMVDMRKKMMSMDQKGIMENRSKYCRDNTTDSACAPEVMKSEKMVEGFDRANSKYCRDNTMDPLCMDADMFKMREQMMSMDKGAIKENRTKYCRDNSTDSACQPDFMNSEVGF